MKRIKQIGFWVFIAPVVFVAMIIHTAYKHWLFKERLNEITSLPNEERDQEGSNGKN